MDELKKNIRRAGFTQLEIAEMIDIKPSTLTSYLNRYNPMPDDVKVKIEEILKDAS